MASLRFAFLLLSLSCCPAVVWTATQNLTCGQRPLLDSPGASRVVGGHDAEVGAWPWQVSIQKDSRHFCGGSIINSKWVLSACHCFYPMPVVSRLWVVAGQRVLSASEDSSQRRGVRRLVLNKGYNKVTHDNDLALLQLTEPLSFSLYVQPVCLLTREEEEAGLELCFISGWGTTTYKGMAVDVLQEAEVQLIPMETCNQWDWYGGILTQHMQCAGNEAGGIDTCQGDSGGPLQCYNEDLDRFYLVGVTSFGEGCASVNRPGVYARVSRYYSWVQYTQDQVRSGVASIQPWLLLTGLTLCTMVQL